jgi:hypothetical protein
LNSGALASRFGLLSVRDWVGLVGTLVDPASWRRLWQLIQAVGRSKAETVWHGLRPLEQVQDIREFATWLENRR